MMDKKDIQGLLVSDHSDLHGAVFLMVEITSSKAARNWLKKHYSLVNDGNSLSESRRIHLAFRYSGLQKLGVDEFVDHGFSAEFTQGMTVDFRRSTLGDIDDNAPEKWSWGGPCNDPIDFTIMVYAPSPEEADQISDDLLTKSEDSGIRLVHRLDSRTNPKEREHFGFKDGISQPLIPGLGQKGPKENKVADGEMILGYKNSYKEYPESPLVPKSKDPQGLLPRSGENKAMHDFGKNGTYMVFRQMRQNVAGFWNMIRESAQEEHPGSGINDFIYVASKMFGRWPNGTPVTLHPNKENPDEPGDTNDFLYFKHDSDGKGCPFGSHIRRCNPRDSMPDNYPKSSLRISNRHRILRRGRIYGPPLHESYEPQHLANTPDDGKDRGLQFICFNANISRQFEFIQHTWCHNSKFFGLYNEPDPIIGIKDKRDPNPAREFTIQASPVRRKFRNLQPMVSVTGGSYFFMPGLKALKFLIEYQPENEYICPNSSELSHVS